MVRLVVGETSVLDTGHSVWESAGLSLLPPTEDLAGGAAQRVARTNKVSIFLSQLLIAFATNYTVIQLEKQTSIWEIAQLSQPPFRQNDSIVAASDMRVELINC